jgi:hypothetical protein
VEGEKREVASDGCKVAHKTRKTRQDEEEEEGEKGLDMAIHAVLLKKSKEVV